MPESDWIEATYRRLNKIEADVKQLKFDVNRTANTLEKMTSDELADLRRRAELPRKLLLAIASPVLVAVVTALVLNLLGGIHLA